MGQFGTQYGITPSPTVPIIDIANGNISNVISPTNLNSIAKIDKKVVQNEPLCFQTHIIKCEQEMIDIYNRYKLSSLRNVNPIVCQIQIEILNYFAKWIKIHRNNRQIIVNSIIKSYDSVCARLIKLFSNCRLNVSQQLSISNTFTNAKCSAIKKLNGKYYDYLTEFTSSCICFQTYLYKYEKDRITKCKINGLNNLLIQNTINCNNINTVKIQNNYYKTKRSNQTIATQKYGQLPIKMIQQTNMNLNQVNSIQNYNRNITRTNSSNKLHKACINGTLSLNYSKKKQDDNQTSSQDENEGEKSQGTRAVHKEVLVPTQLATSIKRTAINYVPVSGVVGHLMADSSMIASKNTHNTSIINVKNSRNMNASICGSSGNIGSIGSIGSIGNSGSGMFQLQCSDKSGKVVHSGAIEKDRVSTEGLSGSVNWFKQSKDTSSLRAQNLIITDKNVSDISSVVNIPPTQMSQILLFTSQNDDATLNQTQIKEKLASHNHFNINQLNPISSNIQPTHQQQQLQQQRHQQYQQQHQCHQSQQKQQQHQHQQQQKVKHGYHQASLNINISPMSDITMKSNDTSNHNTTGSISNRNTVVIGKSVEVGVPNMSHLSNLTSLSNNIQFVPGAQGMQCVQGVQGVQGVQSLQSVQAVQMQLQNMALREIEKIDRTRTSCSTQTTRRATMDSIDKIKTVLNKAPLQHNDYYVHSDQVQNINMYEDVPCELTSKTTAKGVNTAIVQTQQGFTIIPILNQFDPSLIDINANNPNNAKRTNGNGNVMNGRTNVINGTPRMERIDCNRIGKKGSNGDYIANVNERSANFTPTLNLLNNSKIHTISTLKTLSHRKNGNDMQVDDVPVDSISKLDSNTSSDSILCSNLNLNSSSNSNSNPNDMMTNMNINRSPKANRTRLNYKQFKLYSKVESSDNVCNGNGNESDGSNCTNHSSNSKKSDNCNSLSSNSSDNDNSSNSNGNNVKSGCQWQCGLCHKLLSSQSGVITHIRNQHKQHMMQLQKQNEKSNILPSSHMYERFIVTNDLNYQCKQCNKIIKTRGGMISHTKSHLGIKTYQCSYCDLKFGGKTARDRHERRHTGEKPFQCQVCSKRFAIKSGLTAHSSTHTKTKQFECKVCQKKYTQISSLRRHQKQHRIENQTLSKNSHVDDLNNANINTTQKGERLR